MNVTVGKANFEIGFLQDVIVGRSADKSFLNKVFGINTKQTERRSRHTSKLFEKCFFASLNTM